MTDAAERSAKRKRVKDENDQEKAREFAIAAGEMEAIYQTLRQDAVSRGHQNGQVWHEADIDGYHLYMADTSFGNGPIFRVIGLDRAACWQNEQGWAPVYAGTTVADAQIAVFLGKRAEWVYRMDTLTPVVR